MRLRALLDTDSLGQGLGLRLLGGEESLDRAVRGVMTTALRDPSRCLSGGELVLTELAWWHGPADSEYFVRLLADAGVAGLAAGVAGLAAGEAALGRVPEDLVAACRRHRLPLFSVDKNVPFAEITEYVVRQVAAERTDEPAAARAVRRGLADEVLELLRTGAPLTEVAARLRVAAPVLMPALGSAPQWQIAVARIEWRQDGPVPGGQVAQALLEEALPNPVAVTYEGEEAVALVPIAPAADGTDVVRAGELLTVLREPLTSSLGDNGRLTVGVSATVHSADGLRGALEEARHARRVAAARPGRVCAAGHDELTSHVLLLPFVPDDVRRAFTARLLDPLHVYDRRHRAELIPTLEAFLECDASWTRCATRLHLHVNTLRYRVGRIEQLTGRDLSRLEDKLDFFLALRMS